MKHKTLFAEQETLPPERHAAGSVLILSTVALTFLAYFVIGLPLAVLPVFIHGKLGYSAVLAGLGVSVQYIATVVSRAQVGRMTDVKGPKTTVVWGFASILLCGALTILSAVLAAWPSFSFAALIGGRLALGAGESMIGTGAITWAIGLVGHKQTVKVISWNGIATYGGLAAGAPAGVILMSSFGFASIGVCVIAIAMAGVAFTLSKPPAALVQAAERGGGLSVRKILLGILPYGAALGFASTGFGVIAAFVTLLYASHHWSGSALAVTTFGLAFIGARLVLPGPIARFGGLRVALAALTIEGVGLALIWMAVSPDMALCGAALTGFGFGPIFPALGVEAVDQSPPENRGMAIGLYSMFLDVSLGVSGPLAGFLIGRYGYASPFALGVASAVAGLGMTVYLLRRTHREPRQSGV